MRRLVTVLAVASLLVGLMAFPIAVRAAAPTNDDFADARVITSFPFTDTVAMEGSTLETGEPAGCTYQHFVSVWYAFTPATSGAVQFDPAGSFPDTFLALYRQSGAGFTGLTLLTCSNFNYNVLSASVTAGETYYLGVTDFYGSSAGTLSLSATFIAPPANDSFADAMAIPSTPYSHVTSNAAASLEPGEVPPCAYAWSQRGTVWYSYTAPATRWLTASVTATKPNYFYPQAVVGVYTGASPGSLTLVACAMGHPGTTSFQASEGVTYLFQVSADQAPSDITLQLGPPPAPTADFYFYPAQADVFGPVNFQDYSSDPAGIGFAAPAWTFGDGATSTGATVSHTYAADGSYPVTMTATTIDGRTASVSRTVTVETHDLAITKFSVPLSAKAGQTRTLTVSVANNRYPESGVVTIWKGVFPNDQLVCQLEGVAVPVLPGSRTTSFSCPYTFTAQDAAIGSVTFRAYVGMWTWGTPDANPANNGVMPVATRVMP